MSTFLLVHGGFCGSWVWERTAPALEALGHRVVTVDLPSSGRAADRLGDLRADRAAAYAVLDRLAGPVVLVGHSGGGMVLTELADHPDVAHSTYVAALHPQRGQSVADLLGGQMPGWMVVRDDGAVQVSDDAEVVRRAARRRAATVRLGGAPDRAARSCGERRGRGAGALSRSASQ